MPETSWCAALLPKCAPGTCQALVWGALGCPDACEDIPENSVRNSARTVPKGKTVLTAVLTRVAAISCFSLDTLIGATSLHQARMTTPH